MITDVLQNIITRCHQRHEHPLQQRKTTTMRPFYRGIPHDFIVYYAREHSVMLRDLEAAGVSFMPIGPAPGTDRPPRSFGGDRFLKRQGATDWNISQWRKSWGIQVYTGMPSARQGASWHDIDFKYEAICAAPDVLLTCVQALVNAVANPLLTLSKSGGLRFSCRIPEYLHPNAEQAGFAEGDLTPENPHLHDAYFEILGEKRYSYWDGRYEILLGNLLDPPVISKEVLFPLIDAFRARLHAPISQSVHHQKRVPDTPYSLGSVKLDLAEEALFRHGFSYVRQVDGVHYWRGQESESGNAEVSLWENEDGVWVSASTSGTGLPLEATRITDIWKDTGILPPIPETGLPIDDKVPAMREGTLSPLAIKRPRPVLHKGRPTENIHETQEEMRVRLQRAFDRNVRVIGCIPEIDTEENGEVESVLREGEAICLSVSNVEPAAEVEQFLQKRNVQAIRTAEAQTLEDFRLFLDPQYTEMFEQLLEGDDGTQTICIINATREYELFLEYGLSKTILEEWVVNWQGSALGNFAIALLNAVEIRDNFHAASIRRIRAVIQTFEWLAEELIQQMCPVNIQGKAVARRTIEAETVGNIQEPSRVSSDPNWTFWHQLKRFFVHYIKDADAPMRWEDEVLRFWVPPVLHPSVRSLVVTSSALYGEHLCRAFLGEKTEILPTQPRTWVPGNRVFQIRTDTYPRETLLDLSNTWDDRGVSETGQHIFWRIQAEIERDPNIKHGILTHVYTIGQLENIAKSENVCFLTDFRRLEGLETAFQEAEVIWIVGTPQMEAGAILDRTRILFGNDREPLSYKIEPGSYRYKDERVQSVYEKMVTRIFTEIIGLTQLNRLANKKVMLITGLRIPEITDRPETLLFDWEDFDVAGGLDKLAEVIATRQCFETERGTLTVESSRAEVERVLGCSPRQANRILQRMRGGKPRVTFREQILELLADGEKTTPEFAAAILGHPKAINTELTRLVGKGEIVKVKRGVYKLPDDA